MLIHLQSLAGKGVVNRRVDLRVRNKHGHPIYDKTEHKPVPGTLVRVDIVKKKGTRLKYLEWRYEPDDGVNVPSAHPGYARVRLGLTSGNYYLQSLEPVPEARF